MFYDEAANLIKLKQRTYYKVETDELIQTKIAITF